MGLSKKIFLTVALLCPPLTFADSDSLVKDNHKVYFKQGSLKIFLFDDANYCFDKDAFSVESLTNDKRKYLFVNGFVAQRFEMQSAPNLAKFKA